MTAIALVSAASVGSAGRAAGPADASLERLPIDTEGAGPRRNELPLGLDVVDFP